MPIVRLDMLQQFAAINLTADAGAVPGKKHVPSCVEVMLVWNLTDGKLARNVLAAQYSGGFVPTSAIADSILNTLIGGAGWTSLAAFMPTTSALTRIELRDINTVDQPIVPSVAAGAFGTSASPALPSENAVVITLRTALTGPGNRGRAYIPNWATNALGANDVVAAGAVTALQNWANTNLRNAMNSNGLIWSLALPDRVAYTGSTGTAHPARNAHTQPVTSQTVRDNHWDTVRRRGLK